jgi:hypothetical protein
MKGNFIFYVGIVFGVLAVEDLVFNRGLSIQTRLSLWVLKILGLFSFYYLLRRNQPMRSR